MFSAVAEEEKLSQIIKCNEIYIYILAPGPQVLKLLPHSTQLISGSIMLSSVEQEKINCCHFTIYKQGKFHAQMILA